jgi:hypothetical protein
VKKDKKIRKLDKSSAFLSGESVIQKVRYEIPTDLDKENMQNIVKKIKIKTEEGWRRDL